MDDNTQDGQRLPNGQFAPGKSGNPKGKNAGSISLIRILQRVLADCEPGEKVSRAEKLVKKTFTDAMGGDSQARKLIWGYIEGDTTRVVRFEGGVAAYTESQVDQEIRRLQEELGYGPFNAAGANRGADGGREGALVPRTPAKEAGAGDTVAPLDPKP